MITTSQFRTPSALLLLFALLAGVPLVALGWLGWRMLDQDRALERQQIRERLDTNAALLAQESERALSSWRALLSPAAPGSSRLLPRRTTLLVFNETGISRAEPFALP